MATSFDMSWDEVKSGSSNVNFLTLESGKVGNRVRIVSKPSQIDVHWEPSYEDGKRKNNKINCLGSKCILCEHGSKVQHRYQILVIDKTHWSKETGYDSEGPQVKILETGISVMKSIKEFAVEPEYGDPTKYDLIIKKEGTGKDTHYAVVPVPSKSELTDEEKEAVANAPTLQSLNKMHTEKEILDLNLDILSDVGTDTDADANESSETTEEKPKSKGTEDEDWNNF